MVSAIPSVFDKGFIGYSNSVSSSRLVQWKNRKTFCQEGKGSKKNIPSSLFCNLCARWKSSVGIMPFRNGYEKGDFSAFWHDGG
ncbi:hypothetical protein CEXT_745061 [Caerostris extrusa]|uniref:Uncharacterized protein n=1 Tax=Caerostris extrusa TaxID=172846 RepID=A0AAV4S292_CAEEX|nr:hypothetical protein CEXT_745061 [Caerostris extrusa]